MLRLDFGTLLTCLAAVIAAGCGGDTGFSGPEEEEEEGPGTGLTVTTEVEPEYAAVAEALGWEEGVPDADVMVHRYGTDFEWIRETTGPEGVARYEDLVPGSYRIAAYRPLTEGERAQVPEETWAVADGRRTGGGRGNRAEMELTAGEPSPVVFSEIYATAPFAGEVDYDFHMFFEVYNNSDRTVFLDGMIFGTNLGAPASVVCDQGSRFRTDPEGVWAHFLHRFPGSGTEYPLAPGEVAVVALDAVDHSEVHPAFPDLSGADFELMGSGDVNNPNAANLPEVGIQPWFQGHGLRFFIGQVFFLAAPLDVATLERATHGEQDTEILRLPAEALHDVVWPEEDDALREQRLELCYPIVHRSFERLGGGFIEHGEDLEFSAQRRVIGQAGGRRVLQDANVSAVDLIRARYTPGTLP